ncbi:hypothetical protein STEG23_021570 [Scotinomys teguina]
MESDLWLELSALKLKKLKSLNDVKVGTIIITDAQFDCGQIRNTVMAYTGCSFHFYDKTLTKVMKLAHSSNMLHKDAMEHLNTEQKYVCRKERTELGLVGVIAEQIPTVGQ